MEKSKTQTLSKGASMTALLRHRIDKSIFMLTVTDAVYEEQDKEVFLFASDSVYIVEQVPQKKAESLIRKLFKDGKADFSLFPCSKGAKGI